MTDGRNNCEAQSPATTACAQPSCRHANLREVGDRTGTVGLDAFTNEIRADLERSAIRAARVLPAPPDMPAMSNTGEIERRLMLYYETGLRGYLVDIAKFAMWEWQAQEPVRQGVCL